MTLGALRELVFDEIGLNMEQDVLTDYKLIQAWDQAALFWSRYKNPIKGAETIGFTIPENEMSHEFTDKIPQSIRVLFQLPAGTQVPCWLYWYAKPTLTVRDPIGPGKYAVCYEGSLGYEDLERKDVPQHLLRLLCAYVKKKIGQFLKFASYQDHPFDIDGEAWFREGSADAKEVEEFIMINRDESFDNLSDLRVNRRILMYR